MTDTETLAYHEAGHVLIAAEYGGRTLEVSLESDGVCLERHEAEAHVTIDWPGGRTPHADIRVALAGPVAEAIYEGHAAATPDLLAAWQADWAAAWAAAGRVTDDRRRRQDAVRHAAAEVDAYLRRDDVWAVVGDLADALLAHETLDEEMTADLLGAWHADLES